MMWYYTSPLMGLLLYLICVGCYPVFALVCGLNWMPDKRKVMNDPQDPPPRILNLRRDDQDLE